MLNSTDMVCLLLRERVTRSVPMMGLDTKLNLELNASVVHQLAL